MAAKKFDGIVEAVHYGSDGQVEWVRVYERRGPTFTDRIILHRPELVARLKAGKHFVGGQRIATMASTFTTTRPVKLVSKDGKEFLADGDELLTKDQLKDIPVI